MADLLNLDAAIARADMVVTGEGLMDPQSFKGKLVGGVVARARMRGVPMAAVVGSIASKFNAPIPARSLVDTVGLTSAMAETLPAVYGAARLVIADSTRTHCRIGR